MKPLISIIVPVYNVERYLPRCIESILKQTYTNFELILVDDGTPDRSGIICDRYAEKDSRIRVIHKENGGVSTARNAGIDVANGEWITFVDSDDWVSDNYIEMLQLPLKNESYDLVVGSVEIRSMVVSRSKTEETVMTRAEINTINLLDMVNMQEFCAPWMKLFSKCLIDRMELRFPVGIALSEDTIFVNNYLCECESIYLTSKPTYYYNRLNELSIINRTPYFDRRVHWDQQFLKSYADFLASFSVDIELINTVISRKATSVCCINIRTIIKNFSEQVAKEKILELLPNYSQWIVDYGEWVEHKDNHIYNLLVQYIKSGNVYALYEHFKDVKKQSLSTKLKRNLKKMIRPFIEKYRDRLIKFKF